MSGRRPSRPLRSPLPALLLVLFLGAQACASTGSARSDDPVATEAAVVQVANQNWQDMHIYVLAAGQRWSLGMSTSMSERTFEIPNGVFATGRDVVFLADPVGSVVAYHSDPLLLEPGDRVEWTLHNRLRHSSIFIR